MSNKTPVVNPHGFWEGDGGHIFDERLAEALAGFFKRNAASSIVDLGCGEGKYVKHLRECGLNVDGFDGNPNCPFVTNGMCKVLDLAVPSVLEKSYDWVLSLEVAEHLPSQYERIFCKNLHNNNASGIVMSWAVEGQGGHGHFNERNNDYVKEIFEDLGYENDTESEIVLRNASTLWWFKKTIMVFRKKKTNQGKQKEM